MMLLMFLKYLPVAFKFKQVGTCPHFRMAAPMLGAAGMSQPLSKGELVPREPYGGQRLLQVTTCFGVMVWILFGVERCMSLSFSCEYSRGISYKALVTVTLMVFSPYFELGTGKEGRNQAICERYFPTVWSLWLFCFPLQIPLFVSFLLLCLLDDFIHKLSPCPCELVIEVLYCTNLKTKFEFFWEASGRKLWP